MPEKFRNRTLRPSSRELSSPYKVDVEDIAVEDTLVLTIDHEEKMFNKTYYFNGKQLAGRRSIHFSSFDTPDGAEVNFHVVVPDSVFDNTLQPIIIDLNPEWFKPGYYVYVVRAHRDERTFYYVGMTGDRKHLVARSPFYRMGGHFNRGGSSKENQIITGLKEKAGMVDPVHELPLWQFTYYSYLVEPFVQVAKEEHKIKRVKAERIESALMQCMWTHNYNLFNGQISNKPTDVEREIAHRIFDNLKQQLV